MGAALIDLLSGLLSTLAGLLPQYDFTSFFVVADSMKLGIGWLNWLFPVGDAALLMGTWIGLVVAAIAAKKVLGGALGLTGFLGKVLGR